MQVWSYMYILAICLMLEEQWCVLILVEKQFFCCIYIVIAAYPQLTVSDRHISYVQAKLPDHTITDTCAKRAGFTNPVLKRAGLVL